MKLNKQLSMLMLLAFLMLLATETHAQLYGYGAGGSGSPTVSNDLRYEDGIRANVSSMTSTTITLDASHIVGNFASPLYPYKVLLIQMKGGSIGVHEGLDVTNYNSVTHVMTIMGTISHTYSISSTDRVQVLLVPQYVNYTVNNGAVVTCHPWDGYTGGIVCFMVSGVFTANGGKVVSSGRGFLPEGVTWGSGGAGGTAGTSIGMGGVSGPGSDGGSGGGLSPCNSTCYSGHDIGLIVPGYDGGYGENCTTCGASGGISNSGIGTTYSSSTLNTNVIMGNPGYYKSGYGGGDGGPGGGAGAGGGASMSGNSGNNGDPGTAGGLGGDAGQGAAGGGIIYIKAHTFSMGTSTTFFASGGHGENGLPGENGGNGGNGGLGGTGICSGGTAYASGGTGGSGEPGNGSQGGDGGNGGNAGYIWVISQLPPNNVTTSHVDVSGGAGGSGGPGGYSYSYICQGATSMDLTSCSLDISACAPSGSGCADIHVCDCDEAYKILSTATSSTVVGSNVTFTIGTTVVATYTSTGGLTGIQQLACGAYKYYHCPVYNPTECDAIFESIGNNATYAGPFSLTSNVTFLTTPPHQYIIKDNTGDELIWYKSDWQYITDLTVPTGPTKCYNGACLAESYGPAGFYQIYQGPAGSDAEPAPSGNTTPNNTHANFPNGAGNVGWKNGPTGVNDMQVNELGVKLYPNPTTGDVTLGLVSEGATTMSLDIYDLSGSIVRSTTQEIVAGENSVELSLSGLKPGYYMVRVVANNKTSVLPVTLK
ncbi:MAG: T9SS type A sorting domain-containing protein [Bacteroidetes bacterium]|nr:T9SS type A sorting domain-containing protein [Bacteroidota bacterium]